MRGIKHSFIHLQILSEEVRTCCGSVIFLVLLFKLLLFLFTLTHTHGGPNRFSKYTQFAILSRVGVIIVKRDGEWDADGIVDKYGVR